MLPGFIIDQIRKREDDERRNRESPVRELPLPEPKIHREQKRDDDDRGVVIIDLGAE